MKQPTLKLGFRTDSLPHLPQQTFTPAEHAAEIAKPSSKRRGRPPKDKSAAIDPPKFPPKRSRRASLISRLQGEVRARSSLPTSLPKDVFAGQCIEAAHASRLDPYALHHGEHELLSNLIMEKEVTIYLNIRNAILRLWVQNPLCAVTVEEAAGCARDGRFFGLAEVAYKWLVRHGYINFGCVEILQDPFISSRLMKQHRQKTIVVIGAGVAGLTSARQLENLFAQCSERWTDNSERPPRVIVLEGRNRIGGRVYSKPLRSQVAGSLPGNLRNTAEMGAMIVTGFDHGNPLNTVIRGQLGLRYHMMTDELTIYDCDGTPVDERTDMINTELYTDISDRAGDFRAKAQKTNTLRGDEDLIDRARDPVADGFEHFQVEPLFPINNDKHRKPVLKRGRRRNAPPGTEKLTGRTRVIEETDAKAKSAARAAKTMGWRLREGVAKNQSISLHKLANASAYPALGAIMDDAIIQYQSIIDLTPQDMRLLNWHHANLEYANAAPISSLSLSGHDQDTGNEFEGAHSEILGGYTQVPRGLMNLPTKLDVRIGQIVESIHYNENNDPGIATKVVCKNGEVIEADEIVLTAPLGVLKAGDIDFDPPLPGWKLNAINRMGFGLLNKVILLYDKPFWDDSRDMFGLLNDAEVSGSLNPADYAKKRGCFYLIWNATKISGRPMLVALMAGNAAHEAETTDTSTLLADINNRLCKTFAPKHVPAPLEVIVTRWKRDPFTRGTYSYVAPETLPGDYDLMAKPVGNLHFAGEATCGTHPATVHGAFLSGLRVAAEVMECMAGPLHLPNPLVLPLTVKQDATSLPPIYHAPQHQRTGGSDEAGRNPNPASYDSADLSYEAAIVGAILTELGERPEKPRRPGVNPFLLYTKDKWEECKAYCSTENSDAGRDNIRATLGRWWKAAPAEVKQPYLEQSQSAQEVADAVRREYEEKAQKWDDEAKRIREEYMRDHPPPFQRAGAGEGSSVGVSKRKTNVSNCVVLDHT
ncbi:hypothetical protein M433DRAFT_72351 [Acidomyces richmondensis BFW]|nr:MAG: hypothetical protein FE78DRAFT_155398 [Acidomyces sp. 'richmondensis']KYG43138.1 hypothetical protein M433DRAFT_72351 [Acidomyces richmondensis BFW]